MKFAFNLLLLALLAAFAAAVSPQKPVIVSYPEDTPQSVLDKAMDAIKKAVRLPTGLNASEHMLTSSLREALSPTNTNSSKASPAKASEQALDTVQALGTENNVVIEDDQIVSVNDR